MQVNCRITRLLRSFKSHMETRVWRQILLRPRLPGWWRPPENLSQHEPYQAQGWGIRGKSKDLNPSPFTELSTTPLEGPAFTKCPLKRIHFPFLSPHKRYSPHKTSNRFVGFGNSIKSNEPHFTSLRSALKWNDSAVSRRTNFAQIQENPSNAHNLKKISYKRYHMTYNNIGLASY